MFTDARSLGFPAGAFDTAICGFVGWDDCFDFAQGTYTQPDTKAQEVWRVLRDGGRFVCCSWDQQEDLSWMEEQVRRHYPAISKDSEYLEERPIGMASGNAEGYEIIFARAGFRQIEIHSEAMTFVSTDEEEWWRQMLQLGWDSFIGKIEKEGTDQLRRVKEAIFEDLQSHRGADGIRFDKGVHLVRGVK